MACNSCGNVCLCGMAYKDMGRQERVDIAAAVLGISSIGLATLAVLLPEIAPEVHPLKQTGTGH